MHFLTTLPGYIVTGYVGLVVYLLFSLGNQADESLSSLADVFKNHGKTVLGAAVVTPVLVVGALQYNELNTLSAFGCGYLNISIIRKVTDNWSAKAKLTGN